MDRLPKKPKLLLQAEPPAGRAWPQGQTNALPQIIANVHGRAVQVRLEMQVVSICAARSAHITDELALLDRDAVGDALGPGGPDAQAHRAIGADNACDRLQGLVADIEIESLPIPVEQAKQEILDKFDIDVAGCVRYLENDNQWKADLYSVLERL